MPIGSYCGKILQVDLTTGRTESGELDPQIARDFIGDVGINLRLAYDLIKPGIEPLSSSNPIIISAGPLVGTQAPSAVRCSALTKSPINGTIAFGNTSMGLGRRLKYAGYDHVIITGQARQPVYLKIWDDDIEICDAKHLWGKDIFQTTDELWQELGKRFSIVAIGPAGENLVKISLALVDNMASLGMGGLAAVMGSKNLKAITIGGTRRVELSHPEKFKKSIVPLLKAYRDDPMHEKHIKLGKMAWALSDSYFPKVGIIYKNWTELFPTEEAKRLYGIGEYVEKIQGQVTGCPGCLYPCKDRLKIKEGEYKGLETNISSLIGTTWQLGVRCGAGSIQRMVKLADLCNRYGINRLVFIATMDFAVELQERGLITIKDTQGLVLKRDFETTAKLIEMVTFKQGIGSILADGPLGIIDAFGSECDKYSGHVKGIIFHVDPRISQTTMGGWAAIVNPEGAHPEPAYAVTFRTAQREKEGVVSSFPQDELKAYCNNVGMSKEAIDRTLYEPVGYNIGRLSTYAEDFYILLTSLGICEYRHHSLDIGKLAEFYSTATGIEITPGEMQRAGERIWNLYKALNVREGFSRKDDRFPPRWLEPLKAASGEEVILRDCLGQPISTDNLEGLLDDYYQERGWEIERGIPTKEKLMDLGLSNVVRDFKKQGILK